MNAVQIVLLALLAALLVTAVVTDLRARTIANRLNLAVAALGIVWWFASGLGLAVIGLQVAGALAVLLLFGLAFALGAMGGGDVKLIAALALWLPPLLLIKLLILMSIGGGLLTLVMIAVKIGRRSEGGIEIPYGVAISGAALMVMANDILTIPRP
ncbi:prepilin peptidase CpaA [Sphingomonas vulcanisoli]|uniref:Prepilin peptidase CpaA n=1 Tax=Sphingomonas vulcanisoli TaxID=1658060 RepID=A0ABX0TQY1_9SPHN|nr:prepilin peptidase [Sphingomonas vulcanisoli]NIJ06995.1 prepilin peptidase CpaA [Sphingomonas vulcanisoli]